MKEEFYKKVYEDSIKFRNEKIIEINEKEIYGNDVSFEKYIINMWRKHYGRNFI